MTVVGVKTGKSYYKNFENFNQKKVHPLKHHGLSWAFSGRSDKQSRGEKKE